MTETQSAPIPAPNLPARPEDVVVADAATLPHEAIAPLVAAQEAASLDAGISVEQAPVAMSGLTKHIAEIAAERGTVSFDRLKQARTGSAGQRMAAYAAASREQLAQAATEARTSESRFRRDS